MHVKGGKEMGILTNSIKDLANLFGVQILSLKKYRKLLTYQTAIRQLGIQRANIEALLHVDENDNVRAQTEKFSTLSGANDGYAKKLNKALKQNTLAPNTERSNSMEDTLMAQYNECRIARMLLQEKLTTMELSQTSRTKTVKSTSTRSPLSS